MNRGFQYIAECRSEAERMLKIIRDLLDKHRLGEEVTLQKEIVILRDIVSPVVHWNTKQAKKKNIQIRYHTHENIFIEVDILAIQRVLDNDVSGLGIFIVKQIVEAHKGTAGVDSIHGQ